MADNDKHHADRRSERASPSSTHRIQPTIHDRVTECDDGICCCEPEPRWQAVGEELARQGVKGVKPANDQSKQA